MAMTVHVDVVSAEEQIFSGLAELVVLPGEAGSDVEAPEPAAPRRASDIDALRDELDAMRRRLDQLVPEVK